MYLNNKKVLVAGMGETGLSVLRYCAYVGAQADAYDAALNETNITRIQQEFPHIHLFSGSLKDALHDKEILVLSPGITKRQPEIRAFEERGGIVLGDVAILSELLRNQPDKILAITGSNGKTTTTSLVGHLCQQCGLDTVIAGNIGTPVLQAWLNRKGQPADVWVLELSSFQLETMPQLGADSAACLNVSEDHLDRYDDLLDYARAKDMIFNHAKTQVLNADDVLCCAMKREEAITRYFSLNQPSDYYFDAVSGSLNNQTQSIMSSDDIVLQGQHNIANVLAAIALCESIGMAKDELVLGIKSFRGLPHRVEKIGEKNGVVFIDDSKGTNVGATVAAIAGLPEKICLILGGLGKGQDFTPLASVIDKKARAVFLIGQDAHKIAEDLAHCAVELVFCDTLPEATQRAFQAASSGDIVLLSPACASFDMFTGYAHRSQVFIEAFERL